MTKVINLGAFVGKLLGGNKMSANIIIAVNKNKSYQFFFF